MHRTGSEGALVLGAGSGGSGVHRTGSGDAEGRAGAGSGDSGVQKAGSGGALGAGSGGAEGKA